MSHISKIELEIKDLQCLKEACKKLNFEFRENQKEYKWFGRWIGKQPLPAEVSEDMLGSCDHAIHIEGCKYEIGVVKKDKVYLLLWDFWEKGGLKKAIGSSGGVLKQAYTAAKIRKEARMKGYRVTEKRTKQGLRLTLAV